GIDISPRMLDAARERGVYSELMLGDIETALAELNRRYDLIVSADTMTYFGELGSVFAGVSKVLEPGGLYVFASEAKAGDGWEKSKVHRYRHGQSYIRAEAGRAGLEVVEIAGCIL